MIGIEGGLGGKSELSFGFLKTVKKHRSEMRHRRIIMTTLIIIC